MLIELVTAQKTMLFERVNRYVVSPLKDAVGPPSKANRGFPAPVYSFRS